MDTIETEEPRLSMLRALPLMHRLLRLIFVGERERFTKTQFYILITLYHQSPLTMTQIGEHIGASKEQATRAVAPLADEGLVRREVSAKNRTRVYVSLTEAGCALVQELIARCSEKLEGAHERAAHRRGAGGAADASLGKRRAFGKGCNSLKLISIFEYTVLRL